MSIVVLQTAGAFEWKSIGYFDTMEIAIKWVEDNYDILLSDYDGDFYDWCEQNEIKLTEINKLI